MKKEIEMNQKSTESPKKKSRCIVIGKGEMAGQLVEALKGNDLKVRATPGGPDGAWSENDIVFVEHPEIGGKWTLPRFCDGADVAFIIQAKDEGEVVSSYIKFLMASGIEIVVVQDSGKATAHEVLWAAKSVIAGIVDESTAALCVRHPRPGIKEVLVGQGTLPKGPLDALFAMEGIDDLCIVTHPVREPGNINVRQYHDMEHKGIAAQQDPVKPSKVVLEVVAGEPFSGVNRRKGLDRRQKFTGEVTDDSLKPELADLRVAHFLGSDESRTGFSSNG